MATKVIQYKARNGRSYRITYDRSKIVTTAIEYVYEISTDDRSWTSYYGIHQAAAIRLYERVGFQRIPPFGAYVEDLLSLFYEKRIL